MFLDYDRLVLGGTPDPSGGLIQWTESSFGTDPDDVSYTPTWTVGASGGNFTIRNGDDEASASVTVNSSGTTVSDNLTVGGTIHDVSVGDDNLQLSSWGADDQFQVRYSEQDTDVVATIDRTGQNDYDIQLNQGGSAERVFTTADDGTFDAATLGGEAPAYYGAVGEVETVTAEWTFDSGIGGPLSVAGDLDSTNFDTGAITSDSVDTGGVTATSVTSDSGSFTTLERGGESVITAGDDYQPDVTDSGTATATSVDTFDFGTDLSATDNGDGSATVDFSGSVIPSNVYDDGTLTVENADSLDFKGGFDVVQNGDVGEITIANETVSGEQTQTADGATTDFTWDTFADSALSWVNVTPTTEAASTDHSVSTSGTEVTVSYATAPENGETLGWYWSTNAHSTFIDVEAHNHDADYAPHTHDNTNHSETYATETYADNAYSLPDTVTHTDQQESVSSEWTFGAGVTMDTDATTGRADVEFNHPNSGHLNLSSFIDRSGDEGIHTDRIVGVAPGPTADPTFQIDQQGDVWGRGATFETVTSPSVSAEEFNSVLHVSAGDDIHQEINSRASGNVLVKVDSGVVTYGGASWDYGGGNITIVGQGKDTTYLQADSVESFWANNTDRSNVDLQLRDLTLDMNNYPASGRLFRFDANMGSLGLHNVAVENADLTNLSDQSLGLIMATSEVGSVSATGNTEFRLDTTTNTPSDELTKERWAVGRLDWGTAVVGTVYVGHNVIHRGEFHQFHSGGGDFMFNGWRANFADSMSVNGVFIDWDQYAMWARAENHYSTASFHGKINRGGDGDQVRAMGTPDGSGGGHFIFGGSITYQEEVDLGDGVLAYDRGYLTHSNPVGTLHMDNAVVVNGYLPFEVTGARMVTGEISLYNCGHPHSGSHTKGVFIRDRYGQIGKVNLTVNAFNEGVRTLDPVIDVFDTGESHGWHGGTIVLEGTVEGYENTAVNDTTPSWVTVNTDRLFDDGT